MYIAENNKMTNHNMQQIHKCVTNGRSDQKGECEIFPLLGAFMHDIIVPEQRS